MTNPSTIAKGLTEAQRKIWCCGCNEDVQARLTDGREIYPHRRDLAGLPFWRCDGCNNFVGCHHKTQDRTNPLGCIPTKEIKAARQHIHKLIDPLWKGKKIKRRDLYQLMAAKLGIEEYHTAELRSVEDARAAYRAGRAVAAELEE
jgi:hypothetical protein